MAEISLPEPTTPDIYSYGFDRSLNKPLNLPLQNSQGLISADLIDTTRLSNIAQNLGDIIGGSLAIGIDNTIFKVDGDGNHWAGHASFSSAPFSVTNAGALVATSATITGAITATSGRIANWYINTNTISSGAVEATSNVLIDSANSLMRLGPTSGAYITLDGANQRIRSSSYVTGPLGAGFTIEPNFAEFGDIRARGKISTSVFEKDSISAIGGQMVVANADILNVDMTAADNSTVTIVGDTTFAVNDILVIGDGTDLEYMRVTNIASAPQYTVTRDIGAAYGANANPIWKKGTAVTVFGSSDGAATYSGGWLFLKGAGTNAPYYAVVKRTGVAYNAYTEYARLGNLNGFLDYVTDKYGFGVGTTSDYISFDATNNLRINTSTADAITINQGGNIQLKYGGNIQFTSIPAPTACTAALAGAAGNVDIGDHYYKVTFVNAYGETNLGTASNLVTTVAGNQQVNLTSIPTSSIGSVTSRKIYRTKVGDANTYYLLTTLNNNTATTYTDNTADSLLGVSMGTDRDNTAIGKIQWGGTDGLFASIFNTYFGIGAMSSLTSGFQNTAIGKSALSSITSGRDNTSLGHVAGRALTSGQYNTLLGSFSGYSLNSGGSNTLIGVDAGFSLTTQDYNVIIGLDAGYLNTGASNIFIGHNAGYNETGSSKLYIENSNSATPLIYGDFASDYISINGDLEVKTANDLRLYDSDDSNYVGFKAPALTANKIWTLPTGDSTGTQALVSNGSAILSWLSVPPVAGTYLTATAEAGLSAEVNLGALTTGFLYGTVAAGTSTISSVATVTVPLGGTGVTSLTDGGLLVGAGAGAIEALAVGLTTQILVGGGAGINPSWGTDLPSAITIGTKYIYRADGTDVPVADGGTGASTLTDHGVLVGSGTAAIDALAVGTNGQILVGSTGADPVFATLNAGTGLTATTGAGTLQLDADTATTSAVGVAELATDAETLTGTDTGRTITPSNLEYARAQSGWIPSGETWTYASATTFTISGDVTTKYDVGDKIKLTQTTVKYFNIIAISYSNPNTTVTITGGTDYTLANAAITSPFYSKTQTPQGFPAEFSYTPTYSASGSMTYTSVTTEEAKFSIYGKMCHLRVRGYGTTGGTASNELRYTLPITSASIYPVGSGWVIDAALVGGFSFLTSTTVGCASSYSYGNFGLGAGRYLSISLDYPIA